MAWSWEDIGLEDLKAILRHTILCTASLLSFMWLGWVTVKGVHNGFAADCIEGLEEFLLIVLFILFTVHMGCDLFRGVTKNVKSTFFEQQ